MESDQRSNSPRRRIVRLQTHPEAYVSTADLADYWGVSRKQIYKQIDAGTLTALRLGPHLLRIQTVEAIRFERNAKMSPAPEGVMASDEGRDEANAGTSSGGSWSPSAM